MSTRAVIIFDDGDNEFAVYKHCDGNPSNIASLLDQARAFAWPLPRFEADEFATAFIKVAKEGCGGVRLCPNAHRDMGQSYTYTVKPALNQQGRTYLNVMVYAGARGELPIFCGATGGFRNWAPNGDHA